jgi:hypothetical protein
MQFDDEQLELLYRARVLGTNRGQVLEPWAYPEAHRLTEAGWLERRFEPNGDVSWWLTEKADHALDLTATNELAVTGRDN